MMPTSQPRPVSFAAWTLVALVAVLTIGAM